MSRRIRCSVCGLMHNREEVSKITNNKYICNSCLENEDCEYYKCDQCKKIHLKEITRTIDLPIYEDDTISTYTNFVPINDKKICHHCFNYYYMNCECCNEPTHKKDIIKTPNGDFVCSSCLENNYKICPICGHLKQQTDFIETADTHRQICRNCASRTCVTCNDCNNTFENVENLIRAELGYICRNCQEEHNYPTCSSCGLLAIRRETLRDEDTDEILCSICYNRINNYTIRSYHDQSEPFVKRKSDNDKSDEKLYFGLELEVSGRTSVAGKFYRKVKNDVILMNDSSIRNGGFEIVTMPMTIKYFQETFRPKLTEGLKVLIENDFKGHNYGGLHIHVADEAIDKDQVAQLSEILYGNKNDKETWLQITQRKADNMARWSKMDNRVNFYDILEANVDKPFVGRDRYTALNHSTRTNTYEFRIFNSSLRIERILKNLQCVIALLDYSKTHSKNERPVCNTTEFLKFVMSRAIFYPELAQFIQEKNILEQHLNKQFNEMPDVADEERETTCV